MTSIRTFALPQLDVKTVSRYLDLLEKAFVIKRIGGAARNMRNTVVAQSKYYFLDNGVRNGLVSQFHSLSERNDVGALFENFVMMERLKLREYKNIHGDTYFWRTYSGKEIDIVEDRDGALFGFEVKWQGGSQSLAPREWHDASATHRTLSLRATTILVLSRNGERGSYTLFEFFSVNFLIKNIAQSVTTRGILFVPVSNARGLIKRRP